MGIVAYAGAAQVEVRVRYTQSSRKQAPRDASETVILLTPLPEPLVSRADAALSHLPHHFQLVQSDKQFHPHVMVIPVGSVVDFPNRDPFFHNVFSLFNGKRFDLGLYEAGATRSVRFDRVGVSYIFCNIHPQMSAVIITAQTPYYAITDKRGIAVIHNVPDGRYRVRIWSEHALPKTLMDLSREVTVSGSVADLGVVPIRATTDLLANHKDMYGRDYDPIVPASSPYEQ
jgi:plastocyanin